VQFEYPLRHQEKLSNTQAVHKRAHALIIIPGYSKTERKLTRKQKWQSASTSPLAEKLGQVPPNLQRVRPMRPSTFPSLTKFRESKRTNDKPTSHQRLKQLATLTVQKPSPPLGKPIKKPSTHAYPPPHRGHPTTGSERAALLKPPRRIIAQPRRSPGRSKTGSRASRLPERLRRSYQKALPAPRRRVDGGHGFLVVMPFACAACSRFRPHRESYKSSRT